MTVGGRKLRVGLALGSGASHGWAHIGVIRGLVEAGVVPDVVCGTSAGALVGAYHSAGKLDLIENWARGLTLGRTLNYVRVKPGYSLFGEKLLRELGQHFRGQVIEDLQVRYAAVATELASGREYRLRTGSVAKAVLASGAFPLLFPPVRAADRWLVDGCLSNPLPVSACRALGADIVIGVRLSGTDQRRAVATASTEAGLWRDLLADCPPVDAGAPAKSAVGASPGRVGRTVTAVTARLSARFRRSHRDLDRAPGALSMVASSVLHHRRRRRSGSANAADVLVTPALGGLRLGTRAALRAIEAGRDAAAACVEALAELGAAQSDPRHPSSPRRRGGDDVVRTARTGRSVPHRPA